MINSRKISDLKPEVQKLANELLRLCKEEGIELLVTSTYRDFESQNALYAQGRTERGNIITNAKGGESYHNYRVAFDVVPLRNGKPIWSTQGEDGVIWNRIGELGRSVGLDWAGNWTKFREYPHFQYTAGKTIKQLRAEYDYFNT